MNGLKVARNYRGADGEWRTAVLPADEEKLLSDKYREEQVRLMKECVLDAAKVWQVATNDQVFGMAVAMFKLRMPVKLAYYDAYMSEKVRLLRDQESGRDVRDAPEERAA